MKKLHVFILTIILGSINLSAQSCKASFTHSVNGLNVIFNDLSTPTGVAKKWTWDFGDGSFSSVQNPSHTYSTAGVYTACLVYHDSITQCTNTFCDSITITSTTSTCNTSFTFNDSIIDTYCQQANGSISILNLAGGTSPYSFNWSNGSTSQNISGITANTYTVTITDIQGCDTTAIFTVQDLDSNYTYTNTSQNTFQFNSTVTIAGTLNSFLWSFGNGDSSTLTNPSHTYTQSGKYEVCLEITGDSSKVLCNYCDSIDVRFTPACNTTSFTFNDSIIDTYCQQANGSISILNLAGGTSPYSFNWSNGSTSQNISGITANTYTVTITDTQGCDTTAIFTVQDLDSNYTYTNTSQNTFQFNSTVTITGTPNSFLWSFGNGDSSTLTNPSHTYTQSGRYEVCLEITGASSKVLCNYCDSIDVKLTPVGGIEVIEEANEITIHPNPTNDVSYISISKNLNIQRVRVLNLNGQELFNDTKTQNNTSIDLSPFENGIYIIQVFTNEFVFQKKVLKQ